MDIRLFTGGRLCIYLFVFYLVTLITCFSQWSPSLGHFVVSRSRKSCQVSPTAGSDLLGNFVWVISPFCVFIHGNWRNIYSRRCSIFGMLGMSSIGCRVVAVVLFEWKQCWWLERDGSTAHGLGAHGDGNHPPVLLGWCLAPWGSGPQQSLLCLLAVGAGSFPYRLLVCDRKKKRQRESCAKYSLCHLFSLLWHLCKSPLLYCLLLTIKQNLSGSLFLFQRWCRTLIRWCQKASGDFALSTRALWVSEPVG